MENINEHDMTKNMMDIIRGGYKSKLINEADEAHNDTIVPQPGDAVFNEELKKLQDTVDPSVEIKSFKIYPVDRNVIIDGVFLKGEDEDSGIIFRMALKKREVETTMKDIDLNDDVSILLQKLKGYYENWVNEWSLKLANEYKSERQ